MSCTGLIIMLVGDVAYFWMSEVTDSLGEFSCCISGFLGDTTWLEPKTFKVFRCRSTALLSSFTSKGLIF